MIIIWITSLRFGRGLCEIGYLHTRWYIWSGENQKANILKIGNNSQGAVVLSSKAETHRSLIPERSPSHKVEGISRTYEIPLYCLTRPKMVLSVPVCRVHTIVYTYKISELKRLLLKNSKIYNVWIPHFS
jgi:hypothetical protein